MKLLRYGAAFLLTVVMLYVARTNSRGEPHTLSGTSGDFTFELTTVPKILENTSERIWVKVTGPTKPFRVWLRTTQMESVPKDDLDHYSRLEMQPAPDLGKDVYALFVEARHKGGRFWYYFEVTDADRHTLATYMPEPGEPFLLKYVGHLPMWALGFHLLFIFATVFFVSLATIDGIRVVFVGADPAPMMRLLLFATITCFMGMIPFGIPMNYYVFGSTWEGVPFGHDATDNKTQLLFVYLLVAMLSGLRTLARGKFGVDVWKSKGLGWLGIGSFFVMLFIYLIPHSIQFSPEFTYAFCYSWIGVVVLIYIIGWLHSRRKATQV